jgi:hypothetical protein
MGRGRIILSMSIFDFFLVDFGFDFDIGFEILAISISIVNNMVILDFPFGRT